MLHPGMTALGACVLIPRKSEAAQIPSKRKMTQSDSWMIIHMHLCAAGADKVFLTGIKCTFKAKNISS